MPLTEITHIVPALPPAINGLGDYAVVLARALRKQEVASRFVVPTGVEADVDGFPVKRSGRREARALAAALDDSKAVNVVVHFSGYGYARWGLCFWLVNSLRRWRRQGGGRKSANLSWQRRLTHGEIPRVLELMETFGIDFYGEIEDCDLTALKAAGIGRLLHG